MILGSLAFVWFASSLQHRLRDLDNIGQALLLMTGALSAGAFIASACHAARRSVVFPAWLATAGYVVAVLQLAGPFFFPFVLFPLWVLVASIVPLTRDAKFRAGSMAEGHPERKLRRHQGPAPHGRSIDRRSVLGFRQTPNLEKARVFPDRPPRPLLQIAGHARLEPGSHLLEHVDEFRSLLRAQCRVMAALSLAENAALAVDQFPAVVGERNVDSPLVLAGAFTG